MYIYCDVDTDSDLLASNVAKVSSTILKYTLSYFCNSSSSSSTNTVAWSTGEVNSISDSLIMLKMSENFT